MSCKECGGRKWIQGGCAGETLERCESCNPEPCSICDGSGSVDSGGVTPWGSPIGIPCPSCERGQYDECAAIGASWRLNSSLEKWFPLTAEELTKLKELNGDKFKTIQAYCRLASLDKWRVRRLLDAIDQYLSADGYRDASAILTNARADAVNAKPSVPCVNLDIPTDRMDENATPIGPLRKYAMIVPAEDPDREYCVGFNHGLVLAEDYLQDIAENCLDCGRKIRRDSK